MCIDADYMNIKNVSSTMLGDDAIGKLGGRC